MGISNDMSDPRLSQSTHGTLVMLPPRPIVDLRRVQRRRLRHDRFAMSTGIMCRASSFSASSLIPGGSAKRSCGLAAAFYGTIDIHTDLEKSIVDSLGTEDAIIYSQTFSSVSSVIPVLAKREDIIVAGRNISGGSTIASISKKHGRFNENVTKSFTTQTLDSLNHLHSKGIIHPVCRFPDSFPFARYPDAYSRIQK